MSGELYAIALYAYDATESDELSVMKGESLAVLEAYDDGWLLVQRGSFKGLVPANYVEILDDSIETEHKDVQPSKILSSRGSSEDGRRLNHNKNSDLQQLKSLREDAEVKISALR